MRLPFPTGVSTIEPLTYFAPSSASADGPVLQAQHPPGAGILPSPPTPSPSLPLPLADLSLTSFCNRPLVRPEPDAAILSCPD
ncbi:hypothetical protein GQ53DRAFT_399761 [Thozetella sp. PMI_491]|nr:hypothetical protein GQ53DRAFT_399761 [Thozetella sp. PMI_491]